MSLRRLKPGDSVKRMYHAESWNAAMDAAEDFRKRQRAGVIALQGSEARNTAGVLVRNNTGADIDPFAVVGLSTPLILPTETLDEFTSRPALLAAVPSTAGYTGQFGIMLEPARNGEIAKALLAGVIPCQVNVLAEHHHYAEVADGVTANLQSTTMGRARILWKPAGTGTAWCLVQLGTSGVGTFANPLTLGSSSEGSETADTTDWDWAEQTEDDGLEVWLTSRVVYNHAGDKALYGFARKFTFDSAGLLRLVSGETRYTIDATGTCP